MSKRLRDKMHERERRFGLETKCQKERQGFEKGTNVWIIMWGINNHKLRNVTQMTSTKIRKPHVYLTWAFTFDINCVFRCMFAHRPCMIAFTMRCVIKSMKCIFCWMLMSRISMIKLSDDVSYIFCPPPNFTGRVCFALPNIGGAGWKPRGTLVSPC